MKVNHRHPAEVLLVLCTYVNPLWADLCKQKSLQNIAWHWQKPCSYCKWKITADHSTNRLLWTGTNPTRTTALAGRSLTETCHRDWWQKAKRAPVYTAVTSTSYFTLNTSLWFPSRLLAPLNAAPTSGAQDTANFCKDWWHRALLTQHSDAESSISPRFYANCSMVSWQLQKEQSIDLM